MKYTVLKRTIAAFAAGLMLLQTPAQTMAAVVSDNSATYEADETVEQAEVAVSDNSPQARQDSETDTDRQEENLLLNYAYIENGYMEPGEKQNIMVSVGEEDTVFTEAELSLVNGDSGQRISVPVKEIAGNAMVFTFDTTGCEKGVYQVEKVSYSYLTPSSAGDTLQSVTGEVLFDRIPDMENVCFGLGVENPLSEWEFTAYDSNATEIASDGAISEETDFSRLIDMNVISFNGEEDSQAVSGDITEAIEAAQQTLPAEGEEVSADTAAGTSSQEGPAVKKIAGSVVVVIDPGHDASHAGARANGLNEEDLTLKVANYCKEYLEDNYTNVVVHMTRSGASCPYPGTTSVDCNAGRVDAAHQVGADVYVSIHFNSTAGTTSASGAMVFYPNSNYNNSVGSSGATVASKIIEQLEKIGLKNNGIKIRNSEDNTLYPDGSLADYYAVIKRSKLYGFPGVIVEHAFINNPQDAAFLKSEENLKKMGVADALGIAAAYDLNNEDVEYDAENLQVTEIDGANGSFKIVLSGAKPTSRIAQVKFKVYPVEDSSKVYWYTAEAGEEDGIYTATANVQNHGMLTGKYKIIAYAYDAANKRNQLRSTTAVIEEAKLDTSGMTVSSKVSSNEKKVTLTLKGNPGAAEVFFKVYSKAGGSKDVKKYKAEKQKNGNWKAKVTIAAHKSAGDYVVQTYSKSYFGTTTKVNTGSFYIEGPTTKSIQVKSLNLTKGTFQIRVKGVESKAGVKKVSLVVKTLDGTKVRRTYTPKKSKSGYYYVNIDMKDFKYQYGRYGIYVNVTDGNKITEQTLSLVKNIEQPEPVITLKVKSKQTKLSMTASDLGISANVKGVKFKVYHSSNSAKKKTYVAKKSSDGSYSCTINISDFGKSGDYKVLTYVKGANGKFKKVGSTGTVNVADVTGGVVTTKEKTDSSLYLTVKDMKYKGTITKVEVKAWPTSKTSAKYTYKATRRANGSYRALIDSKNHRGTGGPYRYQVIVTTKNGIRKVLLTGKLELGKSTDTQGLYAISGDNQVTVAQMMAYYNKYAKYPSYYKNSDAATLKKFCQIYYDECEKEGIRVEVAFAQAMKETGFLRFGGDVSISQYNFAGIGAVGGGASGQSFDSVRLGVRAQVQHLKAYANEDPLNQKCVDPRFHLVTRGCAPYVEWLGIPDNPYGKGWATADNYGGSILQMIATMKDC